jgi:hypothetical protein
LKPTSLSLKQTLDVLGVGLIILTTSVFALVLPADDEEVGIYLHVEEDQRSGRPSSKSCGNPRLENSTRLSDP